VAREGFDDLAAQLVRGADHGCVGHIRVLEQGAFDFERADPVAGHRDHVVVSGGVEERALRVSGGEVAGEMPSLVGGYPHAGLVGGLVVSGERPQGDVPSTATRPSAPAGRLVGVAAQDFDPPAG
jgi:hypothetical protein